MWKPPTSSCSASTRSNGGRLSSAVAAIVNTMNGTIAVIQRFHCQPDCSATMPLVESVPLISSTAATDRPRAAS